MPQDGSTAQPAQQFKVVGTRPLRPDGIDKVTGKARFGADMHMPGMLYGLVLRGRTRMPASRASTQQRRWRSTASRPC